MRALRRVAPVALAALAALAACQEADVGQPCAIPLSAPDGGPLDQGLDGGAPSGGLGCGSDQADYFETGGQAVACPNLVCIRSPTGVCPTDPKLVEVRYYCSKPCVSDDDCFKQQTGLVCRPVVLDANFLAALDPATRQIYLGDVQASSYCATPSP